MDTKNIQILPFTSALRWEQWLDEYHTQFEGIWMKIAKKSSGVVSVTYDEALDVALCYGWIDGQRKTHDDLFFLQKFTPRRRGSLWSQRNVSKIDMLISTGRMKPTGLAEVEAAQQDGRWAAAYTASKNLVVPEDFLAALRENEPALSFFNTLNKANIYAIVWRLETAKKPETRKRRFDTLLAMLEKGEFR